MTGRQSAEAKTDTGYWSEYSQLQHIKHGLLREYLGGWFPILSRWNGKVVYLDTHAGRGRHRHGQIGSPLVAMQTLLGHTHLGQITQKSSVRFIFIEKYADSANELKAEIEQLGKLPQGIEVTVWESDYEKVLTHICDQLDSGEIAALAPMFMFLDPYSFILPIDKIKKMLSQQKVEVFVNVMWRYISLAMANPTQISNMNRMFGQGQWEHLAGIRDNDARCDATIRLLCNRVGARHPWVVKMYDRRRVLKYALVYLTNHVKGLRLMKDAAWRLDGAGEFRFLQLDDPNQNTLIAKSPDLRPLEGHLLTVFGKTQFTVEDAKTEVDKTIWRHPHLTAVLKNAIESGRLELANGETRLVLSRNPKISFTC